MGLPKIAIPLHDGEILSTGEKITYSAFTVKQEKILLVAQESKDIGQIFIALEQVIGGCVDVDVSKITLFDMTHLLLKIRSISVSDVADFTIIDPDTEEEVKLELNINNVTLYTPDNHNKTITLSDGSSLLMTYPSFREMSSLKTGDDTEIFDVMISCMGTIVQGDSVYTFSDFSEEEVLEFVEGLVQDDFESIKLFFDTMPDMRFEIPYTNSNEKECKFTIGGLESFFT